jgi:nitrite reductase/ring-hydroxylating ferredoxin subunit
MSWLRPAESEPLWRDEFSVHAADERYVTRRQLTKFLVLTSVGMFAGNIWILMRSIFHRTPRFPALSVGRADELPIGGVKLFGYPTNADRCILVRTAENSYAAYSQKCTHLSCAVYYSQASNRLECPCHNGAFAIKDGLPVQGPPRRPLPKVVLEQRGGELIATGIEEG